MKVNLLKTMFASVLTCTLMANVQAAYAESVDLKPTQTTKIQANGTTATNADVVLYDADATSWTCSQSKISNGAFSNMLGSYEGSPVVLTKFDASSTLTGKMVTKATLTFKSVCTVSGKNSNVQVAQVNTGWDATTATWTNTNTSEILNAVNINGDGTNVKTTEKTLTIDVTENLKASTDNTIGFGIYTYTGREQRVSDFNLAVEYIDASASANYTIKYVDGEGNEIKESVQRTESTGASISLKDADKDSVYNADKTKKYIYVSDDSEGKTVAEDGTTVVTVTFREANKYGYRLDAVDPEGESLKEGLLIGIDFEGETVNAAYPAVLNFSGRLYTAGKLSNDGKGYYLTLTLSEETTIKKITYTASETTDVVYFSEAEDIEGLTEATNANTAVRSSNGASAYAADSDVVFTKLPAGKYKLTTVICDASKNAGSVWNFTAGNDTVFTFTAGTVNWAQGTSDEFTLTGETAISLCKGGNANQAVDFIYIQKTGDYVVPETVVEKFSDLLDLEDGTEVTIKTTDAVISVNSFTGSGYFVCVQDSTGAMKLSNDMASMFMGIGLSAGTKIVGTIYATYTAADGTPTLDIAEKTEQSVIDMEAGIVDVEPVLVTVAEAQKKSNLSRYVEVQKAKMWADEDDWSLFYISQGTDTIQVYDAFWAMPENFTAPDSIEYVKGVVVLHDGKPTIYPYGENAVPLQVLEVENIAALADVEENSVVMLKLNDAQITVVKEGRFGTTAYLEDESGAVEFGDVLDTFVADDFELKEGTVLNGAIYVMYAGNYGGMCIMSDENTVSSSIFSYEEGTATPTESTIADVQVESNGSRFVSFKNMRIETEKGEADEDGYYSISAIYMVQGTDSLQLYDLFGALPVDSNNITIIPDSLLYAEGVLGFDGEDYYFVPTKLEVADAGPDTGIKAAAASMRKNSNAAVYSVSGVKVREAGQSREGLTKGLYIIDGKKVVIK